MSETAVIFEAFKPLVIPSIGIVFVFRIFYNVMRELR